MSKKGVGSDLTVYMGQPLSALHDHTRCHVFTDAGKSSCENVKWSFCIAIQKSLNFMTLKANVSVKLCLILECDLIVTQ